MSKLWAIKKNGESELLTQRYTPLSNDSIFERCFVFPTKEDADIELSTFYHPENYTVVPVTLTISKEE